MESHQRLSTRAKLILGFSVILLLNVAILLTAIVSFNSIIRQNKQVARRNTVLVSLNEIKADQNRTRALILELMLNEDRAKHSDIKKQIREKTSEISAHVGALKDFYRDSPSDLTEVDRLIRLLDSYMVNRETQFKLIDAGKTSEAIALGSTVQTDTYEQIRAIIVAFEAKERNLSEQISANAERSDRISQFLIVGIGITAICIIISMIFIMFSMLRKIMGHLRKSIQVINNSTSDILATATEVATGATETAIAIAETTTTIEEVRQTAQVSSEKASLVSEISQKAAGIALKGKESVLETIEGMKKISRQMSLISESVIKLSDQSRTIAEITTTVNDIADQSNLLAVNAAIEAAKAGEQGRGFTVVAQEIRSLAEQSKQATSQVREILNDIQKSVNLAVQATENGSTAVETGSVLSFQSGEVIQMMTDSATETAQAAIQILASSQQQKVGMEQLVPAMENIKVASEQSLLGNKQTQQASLALDELGKNLKDLIEYYNV